MNEPTEPHEQIIDTKSKPKTKKKPAANIPNKQTRK